MRTVQYAAHSEMPKIILKLLFLADFGKDDCHDLGICLGYTCNILSLRSTFFIETFFCLFMAQMLLGLTSMNETILHDVLL